MTTPQEPAMGVSELLLCPFCGSNNISDGEVLSAHDNGDTFKQSACLDCGAVGPEAQVDGPDYGDVAAIAAWNTRAALPHMQPAGEAVGQVLEDRGGNLYAMLSPGIDKPRVKSGMPLFTTPQPSVAHDWNCAIAVNARHGCTCAAKQPSAEPQQAWTQCPKCECWFQPPTTPTTLPDGSLLKSMTVQQEARGAVAWRDPAPHAAAPQPTPRATLNVTTPPAPVDVRVDDATVDRMVGAWFAEESNEFDLASKGGRQREWRRRMRAALALLSAQPSDRIDAGSIDSGERPSDWDAVDEALLHWYGHRLTFSQSERQRFFDAIQKYIRAQQQPSADAGDGDSVECPHAGAMRGDGKCPQCSQHHAIAAQREAGSAWTNC